MSLSDIEKQVAKQLGIPESEYAKGKAEAQRGRSATPRGKTTVLASALTVEQRAVAKQMGISPVDYALSLAEDAPETFARQFAKTRATAGAATANGFKQFDRVAIDADDPASGVLSFDTEEGDGLLRESDHVSIAPGDSEGEVTGPVQYLGDDGEEGVLRVIQSGDLVAIGRCQGTISNISKGAKAKAKLSKISKRIAQLEAKIAAEKAQARAKTKRKGERASGRAIGNRLYIAPTDKRPAAGFDPDRGFYILRGAR